MAPARSIRVFADVGALVSAAAKLFARQAEATVGVYGRFTSRLRVERRQTRCPDSPADV
jgi:hypothetical protein